RINQINYIELNPLEAKFKTSSLRSWKTDQSDAHKLAQIAPFLNDSNSLNNTTDDIFFELRERARFHLEFENEQNRLKVEIIEILHQTFPGLEKLFKNRYSMIALNIAEIFTHPDFVLQDDSESIISTILKSTDKGLSQRKAESYRETLFKLANDSYPNVNSSSFLVKKAQLLIQKLKKSIGQLSQLDKEMIQLAQELDCFEIIYSI
ncbi:IS110 family transposase, partial [Mammaliicoccus sciuri]